MLTFVPLFVNWIVMKYSNASNAQFFLSCVEYNSILGMVLSFTGFLNFIMDGSYRVRQPTPFEFEANVKSQQ